MIVCESHTAPRQGSCNVETDVRFWIDQHQVTSVQRIDSISVAYRGKQHCVWLGLPEGLDLGVTLGIEVSNTQVTLARGPCSIAHVVWVEA